MNRPKTMAAVLGLAALTLLGGCGIRGGLERPDPLWNSEAAIRHECEERMQRNQRLDPRCERYQTGANSETEQTGAQTTP